MPRRFLILLLPALCLATASEPEAPAAGPTPALWLATRGADTAWLFGTIHVGRNDMYPFPAAVLAAIAVSQALALEVDMDDQAMAMKELEHGFYAKGDDLTKHLSPESLTMLDQHLQATGQSVELMKGAKPWYVAMLVTIGAISTQGYDMFRGVEMKLMQEAQRRRIEVIGLEDPDVRYPLMDSIDQDAFLRMNLAMLDQGGQVLDGMITCWKRGDVEALTALVYDPTQAKDPQFAPMMSALIDSRNVHMADAIEAALEEPGRDRIFVGVGAAHLLGQPSIGNLLAQRGWTVSRVSTTP